MAMNNAAYCADHGLAVTDQNLAYTARVRAAATFLRARTYKRFRAAVEARGGSYDSDGPERTARLRADYATAQFENRAMANRRLGRDRQSRKAQAQRVRLMHAAPLRVPVPQAAIDGLALFDSVRSPAML
jgi:hypothetical protein